jgi:DNA polymerase
MKSAREIKKVTLDFETRSPLPLKGPNSVGAWMYSRCPQTEVMCLAYAFDDEPVKLWHPAFPGVGLEAAPPPEDFFRAIKSGALLEAHNSQFEDWIWRNVCVPRLGWPAVPDEAWRCTAAKASTHGLPRSLEDAVEVMAEVLEVTGDYEPKDMTGSKLMQKMCKPKKDGTWHETREDLERLFAYCRQDVRAERALSSALRELPPRELEAWQMSNRINLRGFKADRQLAVRALALRDEALKSYEKRFKELTGGLTPRQREAFKDWVRDQQCGAVLADTTAGTLGQALKSGKFPPKVAEAIAIVAFANRTSTKKYNKVLILADPADDRIRGGMLYCGAERTWRYAGRGIQPHNFPRGKVKNMDAACEAILTEPLEWIRAFWSDDPVEFFSHCLRGIIVADTGKALEVSDFAAIEARVVFWLAGEDQALAVLASGECIYCDMASVIYGEKVSKKIASDPKHLKQAWHAAARQMGKQAILGLGFGMGAPKFVVTCAKYNIVVPNKLADKAVKAYRGKYKKVVAFWTQQENAAVLCLLTGDPKYKGASAERYKTEGVELLAPGRVRAGKVTWEWEWPFLRCVLPSGRPNVYPFARLEPGITWYFKAQTRDKEPVDRWVTVTRMRKDGPFDEADALRDARRQARDKNLLLLPDAEPFSREKHQIVFRGIDDKRKWSDIETYSGKLTENIVQGTARDLMVEAMLRAEERGHEVILSVHDEVIAEVDSWDADAAAFNALMAELPDWAAGCPVNAEGWVGRRYRK